jgi:hypothetical protein
MRPRCTADTLPTIADAPRRHSATMPRHWLMKSEPDECSIDDLARAPGSRCRGPACATTRRATSCATRCARRRRALLPLVLPRARHRRPGAMAGACTPRPHAVRPRQPLPRPQVHAATSRAGCRSRALVRKTRLLGLPEMRAAPVAGHDAGAAARQPAVDHAGHRREWQAVLPCSAVDGDRSVTSAGCWWPSCWCWAACPASCRAAGHGRRHDDGAVHDLDPVGARRRAGAGGEDGHRHVDGHHPVHLDVQRARPPCARRRALGPGARWRRASCRRPALGRRGCSRAQGPGPGAVLRAVHRLLGHADAAGPQAQALATDAGPVGQGLVGSRHRLPCRAWSAPAAPSCRCPS